jgi:hypothetical protein
MSDKNKETSFERYRKTISTSRFDPATKKWFVTRWDEATKSWVETERK